MNKKIKLGFALVASSLLLAGCGNNDNPTTGTTSGTSQSQTIPVTSVSFTGHEASDVIELFVGDETTLLVSILPTNASDQSLVWTSSNSNVAVALAGGRIIGQGAGTATIRAASTSQPDKYAEITVSVSIKDTDTHVTGIGLNKPTAKLNMYNNPFDKLVAAIAPDNATNKGVTWSSSNPDKVSVDAKGNIVAKAATDVEEEIVIKATANDKKLGVFEAACRVQVEAVPAGDQPVSSVTASTTTVNLDLVDSEAATARVYAYTNEDAEDKAIDWKVEGDNPRVTVEKVPGLPGAALIVAHDVTEPGEPIYVYAESHENHVISAAIAVNVVDTTEHIQNIDLTVNGSKLDRDADSFDVELYRQVSIVPDVLPATAKENIIKWEFSANASEHLVIVKNTPTELVVTGKALTGSADVKITAVPTDDQGNEDREHARSISVVVMKVDGIATSLDESLSVDSYRSKVKAENLQSAEGLQDKTSDMGVSLSKFFSWGSSEEDAEKFMYRVGNQGEFAYVPTLNITLRGGGTSKVTNPVTKATLEVYDSGEGEFAPVDIKDIFEVANNKYTFKNTTENADYIGKVFKLNVEPDERTYSFEPSEHLKNSLVFKLVEGYNVDSLAELSLFDNSQTLAWAKYRKQEGLTGITANGGLVLHRDIKIKASIIPEDFVWSETDARKEAQRSGSEFATWAAVAEMGFDGDKDKALEYFIGSPKDFQTIFNRNTHETDKDFYLEGNTFSIDASGLKSIAKLDDDGEDQNSFMEGYKGNGSHSHVFGFNIPWSGGRPDLIRNQVETHFRNISFKGNSNENLGLSKGSFMFAKSRSTATSFENALTTNTFTAFYSEIAPDLHPEWGKMTVNRCISYDTYNSAVYNFGTAQNYIKNSFFAKSGGPLSLSDDTNANLSGEDLSKYHYDTFANLVHDYPENERQAGHHYMPATEIEFENCYLNNPVAGTEPWFTAHPGSNTLVMQMVNQGTHTGKGTFIGDASWNLANKKFLDGTTDLPIAFGEGRSIAGSKGGKDVINLIAINVYASNFDGFSYPLKGSITVKNGEDAEHNYYKNVANELALVNPSGKIVVPDPTEEDPERTKEVNDKFGNPWGLAIESSAHGFAFTDTTPAGTAYHQGGKSSVAAEIEARVTASVFAKVIADAREMAKSVDKAIKDNVTSVMTEGQVTDYDKAPEEVQINVDSYLFAQSKKSDVEPTKEAIQAVLAAYGKETYEASTTAEEVGNYAMEAGKAFSGDYLSVYLVPGGSPIGILVGYYDMF